MRVRAVDGSNTYNGTIQIIESSGAWVRCHAAAASTWYHRRQLVRLVPKKLKKRREAWVLFKGGIVAIAYGSEYSARNQLARCDTPGAYEVVHMVEKKEKRADQ
jgi:hypothetical protein